MSIDVDRRVYIYGFLSGSVWKGWFYEVYSRNKPSREWGSKNIQKAGSLMMMINECVI